MLFHELGEDGILALELGLEAFYFLVVGIFDGLGLAAVLEGGVAVLEELFLPAVEEGGSDAELIADIGDGDFFEQVPFEGSNLLLGAEMTTLAVHEKPPFR
jgi:hypothetical protein